MTPTGKKPTTTTTTSTTFSSEPTESSSSSSSCCCDCYFRVMTFNVRGSFHRQDGMNTWRKRRDLHLHTIRGCNADIIGFQEVQSGNFDAYEEVLASEYDHVKGYNCKRPMEDWWNNYQDKWLVAKSVTDGIWSTMDFVTSNLLGSSSSQYDEYCPIYWKRNRFSLVKSGAFYLSKTPHIESVSWKSKLLRCVTWVHLREKSSSELLESEAGGGGGGGTAIEFIVSNTHFPHEQDDQTRTECARVMIQQLSSRNLNPQGRLPEIVLGDFNCPANLETTTEAYKTFLRNGYQDTYYSSCVTSNNSNNNNNNNERDNNINTFHHFLGNKCPFSLGRIDWILTKNSNSLPLSSSSSSSPSSSKGSSSMISSSSGGSICEAIKPAEIILYSEPPLYPSDHYPVVADLVIRKRIATTTTTKSTNKYFQRRCTTTTTTTTKLRK